VGGGDAVLREAGTGLVRRKTEFTPVVQPLAGGVHHPRPQAPILIRLLRTNLLATSQTEHQKQICANRELASMRCVRYFSATFETKGRKRGTRKQ
jgi:hypothetical protein